MKDVPKNISFRKTLFKSKKAAEKFICSYFSIKLEEFSLESKNDTEYNLNIHFEKFGDILFSGRSLSGPFLDKTFCSNLTCSANIKCKRFLDYIKLNIVSYGREEPDRYLTWFMYQTDQSYSETCDLFWDVFSEV